MKGKTMNILSVLRGTGLAGLLLLPAPVPAATAPQTPRPPAPAARHPGTGIIHGQPAGGLTPPWIARVGKYHPSNGSPYGMCTGEFITKQYVLTALHCVQDEDGDFLSPDKFWVAGGSGNESDLLSHIVPVRGIIPLNGNTDVALLNLGSDYTAQSVNTVPLYHGDGYKFKDKNDNVMIMGFGFVDANETERATELMMARMSLAWETQPGMDMYGGKALQLNAGSAGGDSRRGDSGGPALFSMFGESDNKDFKKLAGILSFGINSQFLNQTVKESVYTQLSPDVLRWLSDKAKITIIRSPVDEQVFEPATQAITVSWYGDAPSRVELKKNSGDNENNNPVLTRCSQVGANSCNLDVRSLPGNTNYDISVVRTGDSVDTVTVRFISDDTKLSVVYPPEQANNSLYIYQPQVAANQTRYTVHGLAAAETPLKARLEPLDVDGQPLMNGENDTPCLDDYGAAMADIKADEQGGWVCNIGATQNDGRYRFLIRLKKPPADAPRVMKSVKFRVNGGVDNGSRVSIDQSPWLAYVAKRGVMRIDGEASADSHIKIASSLASVDPDKTGMWSSMLSRPQNDAMSMTVTARMFRDKDIVSRSPYRLPEPDATASMLINFVDSELTHPVQTMVAERASVITTSKVGGYHIQERLNLNGNKPLEHFMMAEMKNDGVNLKVSLCDSEGAASEDWSCEIDAYIENIGDYIFSDNVEDDNFTRLASRQALVHIVDPPLFIDPKQSNSDSSWKISLTDTREKGMTMKGIIPDSTYNYAEARNDNETIGTVRVFSYDANEHRKGDEAGLCTIVITGSEKIHENGWECQTPIKLTQPGNYQAEVQFNSQAGDDIGGITRFTLVPPEALVITTPQSGKRVTTEAVTPSGTGEKKQKLDIQLTGPGSRPAVRAGDSACPVRAPACSTTVGDKGKWQCPPEAVTEEGKYTVRATGCDGDKVISEDSSTFTVKHRECPEGYTMNADGECEGPPKQPGGPGGGGGIGGFGWPFGLAGGCPLGSWLTGNLCIFPPGRHCPAGYTYDKQTQSCQGPDDHGQCPSGYMLDGNTCSGPLPGGPDFLIQSPATGAEWDCRQDCYVYGQVPEGDTAVVTLNDPVSGQVLPGTGSYPSAVYDGHPTLWVAGPVPVSRFPGRALEIRAQRMHNGRAVPGVEALQAQEVTTPSYVPYAVLWPTEMEEVKSETPDAIRGTAPTGTRVQVTTVPPSAPCDVVSAEDRWACPARTFAPGEHSLTATWLDAAGQPAEEAPVTRTFRAGPLPAVTITAPAAGARLSQGPYAIAGTGHPGATVTVTGMPAGPACEGVPVGADGTWTCGAQYPLVDGEWHLLATQTFGDGLSNAAAEVYSMSGQDRDVLTFESPGRDAVLREGPYNISGRGTPYALVTVTGMPAGPACDSVVVSMYGDWACPGEYPLQDGHYRLQAVMDGNDGWQDAGMTAWREYSMVAPPGPVADITVLPGNNGCSRTTTTSYTCTTVLHLSDAAGKAVPGQTVSATMSGKLTIKRPPTPDTLVSDGTGNVTVTSGGSRDPGNGSAPWGTLKATAGTVTRSFLVPDL